MRLSIVNGRVVDPARNLETAAPVHVADGRIVAIGPAPAGFVAQQTLDARGLVVAPGFVDLAARLREPGYEYRATLESEMQAALAGGVTSLSCPPDTDLRSTSPAWSRCSSTAPVSSRARASIRWAP